MNKEKQIAKMTEDICGIQNKGMKCGVCDTGCECRMFAEALYNIGYRKQSEAFSCGHEKGGEWIKDNNKRTCSLCGYLYYSNNDNFYYCPHCGAKMKGGAE